MSKEARNVMLAAKWDDSIDPLGYWMSEKLDGVRAYWNGKNFYSRQGNLFDAPKWFKEDLPNTPLDGELWCGRGLFQKCIGIVKQQKNSCEADWKFITYLVFDAPAFPGLYEQRVEFLKQTIRVEKQTTYASVVGIRKCEGRGQLKKMLKEVEDMGGEGIMLREPRSAYMHERSTVLLKVKSFHDEEALVLSHKGGTGRLQGIMGGLNCVLTNGKKFTVGSGFSDAQRRKPPKKGAVITFKFQEITNDGIPRFPVFLRIRPDVTWEDVCENAKKEIPVSAKPKIVSKLKKQHTILWSTVPSRDASSGTKILTDDDQESEGEEDDEQPKNDNKKKPMCKFGANCYRNNEIHSALYDHPKKEEDQEKKDQNVPKIKCKWGLKCYLKKIDAKETQIKKIGEIHLQKYSHPDPNETENEENEEENKPDKDYSDDETDETNIDQDKTEVDNDFDNEEVVVIKKSEWQEMQDKMKRFEALASKLEEKADSEDPTEPPSKKRKLG